MSVDTARGRFHKAINEQANKRKRVVQKMPLYHSCDPAAMAVALDSSIVLESETKYCDVELCGELTRGQMVVDWNGRLAVKTPNVDIVQNINIDKLQKFYEMMVQ